MKVRLDAIIVGERRRQELGDIDGLASSIQRYGLLHPIVVDAEQRLIAGGRRLVACERLGWCEVETRSLGDLSEAERREIELEENLRRKDLTEYERSRDLVQLAESAAQVLTSEFSTDSAEKPLRGRPRKPDSNDRIAERIGRPRTTIQEAQTHVETADAYPFMQTWKQYDVLEAHEALEKLPAPERASVAALLEQPGIPAKSAIEMVRNVASKPETERARIYELAESADLRDRQRAVTEAAAKPPMPDPRLSLLDDAARILKKAERMFPGDEANPSIVAVLELLKMAHLAVKESRRG
jgi:ParB-like chromosome segregation protein Spo0J